MYTQTCLNVRRRAMSEAQRGSPTGINVLSCGPQRASGELAPKGATRINNWYQRVIPRGATRINNWYQKVLFDRRKKSPLSEAYSGWVLVRWFDWSIYNL